MVLYWDSSFRKPLNGVVADFFSRRFRPVPSQAQFLKFEGRDVWRDQSIDMLTAIAEAILKFNCW